MGANLISILDDVALLMLPIAHITFLTNVSSLHIFICKNADEIIVKEIILFLFRTFFVQRPPKNIGMLTMIQLGG